MAAVSAPALAACAATLAQLSPADLGRPELSELWAEGKRLFSSRVIKERFQAEDVVAFLKQQGEYRTMLKRLEKLHRQVPLLAVATISGPTTVANSCCNCHRFATRAVALRRSALDRRAPRLRYSAPRTRPAAALPLCLGSTGASQVPPRPSRSPQGGWPLSVCPDQPAKRPAWHSTGPGCPLLHTVHACVC
jgi:hypothetical protein